jgi:hypothetical protein
MTLNYDCIRDLLLYLEESLGYKNEYSMEHKRISINNIPSELTNYSKEDVRYTVEKLYEANFIHLTNISYDNQKYILSGYIDDITWDGFNFLNNIREKSIWEATKSGAKKIGAVSISTLSTISFEIVKAIITRPEVIKKIISNFM